jgi:hypothetical protein
MVIIIMLNSTGNLHLWDQPIRLHAPATRINTPTPTRRGPAGAKREYLNISLGQIDGTVRAQTVSDCFRLFQSLQHGVCSEVPFFCSIFNSKRSSNFSNLLIHRPSVHSIADVCSLL